MVSYVEIIVAASLHDLIKLRKK